MINKSVLGSWKCQKTSKGCVCNVVSFLGALRAWYVFMTSKCHSFITNTIGQGVKVVKSRGNQILNFQFWKNNLSNGDFLNGETSLDNSLYTWFETEIRVKKSWHVACMHFCNCRQNTVSLPSSVLSQTIFPHYNPIRMSSWSFRGTSIPLTVTTRPPVQQRSMLVIYWFHTTPPRSTITFSIKLLILSDGV